MGNEITNVVTQLLSFDPTIQNNKWFEIFWKT